MDDLAAGERELDREQARYLTRVHRLRAGDRFVAFDPKRGVEHEGEIVSASRVRLGQARAARVLAARVITWIHGCPKGDKADAIVRDATELGATRIVFALTERVVVARPKSAKVERWARVAREAARQCGRSDAPDITLATWEEALETRAESRICLDPRGEPLRDVLARARGSLALAAGPEGGFTEAELDIATQRGFATCRLGQLVMRTETAPAAVLGAVALFD
jgi:16S rRNA (uracil1498-N3)-methyltransferase